MILILSIAEPRIKVSFVSKFAGKILVNTALKMTLRRAVMALKITLRKALI